MGSSGRTCIIGLMWLISLFPFKGTEREIPIFVEYFIDKYAKKYNKKIDPLSDSTMRRFLRTIGWEMFVSWKI
jgi:transcriptional regulator with PAS, ATPase and Fis domain